MRYFIAIVGALLGAAGGYGIALMLSTSVDNSFTAVATAVVGGVILSAAFSGVHSAIMTKHTE